MNNAIILVCHPLELTIDVRDKNNEPSLFRSHKLRQRIFLGLHLTIGDHI